MTPNNDLNDDFMGDFKKTKRELKNAKREKKSTKDKAKEQVKAKSHAISGIGDISSHDGTSFVEGIADVRGGDFKELYIEGISNNTGDIKAGKIDIEGIFDCEGSIEVEQLLCEGVSTIKGSVRAKEVIIEGVVTVDGSLESDKIMCKGVLRVDQEISADLIKARGAVTASEIVGEDILIRNEIKKWLRPFMTKKKITVQLIEATTIELHRVLAIAVNGHDIHIGPKCKIERVDCSGSLYLDPTAEVGEITGEYERKQC